MIRRDAIKAAAGAALLSLGESTGRAGPSRERPNVLLITSEDHGPHLSCYGDPNVETPNLDTLASEGARFENAYITNPVCSPSRGSIFTGLYPHQNGQIGLATHKYAMFRDWPNIPSILKGAGYRTGIIGKLHVNPESAFPFDFKAYSGSNFGDRPMHKFAEEAAGFINASYEPFFLMVNFPDAHFPLHAQQHGLPERPFTGEDIKQVLPHVGADSPRLRQLAADYYNCIRRLDAGIGMLMEELRKSDKADNTLVIYLSDHGAQFSRGKTTLYEGGVKVPFMVRWPGRLKAGTVRDELISSIDILPTILAATGIEGPGNLPGASLLPLCRGESPRWRRYAFTEKDGSTPFWTCPRRTVRDERYKLGWNPLRDRDDPTADSYLTHWNAGFVAGTIPEELAAAPEHVQEAYATWKRPPLVELYDLQTDPQEWTNLAGRPAYEAIEKRLLTALQDWQRDTGDPAADPAKLAMLVAEMDEVMASEVEYRKQKDFRWRYLDYLNPAEAP